MKGTIEPVGVIGGGSWGTTIAHAVAAGGGRPLLWVRDEAVRREIRERRTNRKFLGDDLLAEGIETTGDLGDIARRTQVILVVVPVRGFREVARALGEHLAGDRIVISCAKGIEPRTFKRMTDVLKEETCAKKVGVLSGPNLAVEIVRGQPAASVVASRFDEVIERATAALMTARLRIYGSHDVAGVEIAGALKNIIAIAAGIVDGLGFGDNSKATLVTRGLAEIARYGGRHGANPLTFSGLAGVGDLIATCGSALSRNHKVGVRLGKGERLPAILASMVETAEGVSTTRVVHEQAQELGIDMPIAAGVHKILYEAATPEDVLAELMARPPLHEIDPEHVEAVARAQAAAPGAR
jgi:glycerol-3-phosphate dehydrogenase (NAD(P)+)